MLCSVIIATDALRLQCCRVVGKSIEIVDCDGIVEISQIVNRRWVADIPVDCYDLLVSEQSIVPSPFLVLR